MMNWQIESRLLRELVQTTVTVAVLAAALVWFMTSAQVGCAEYEVTTAAARGAADAEVAAAWVAPLVELVKAMVP